MVWCRDVRDLNQGLWSGLPFDLIERVLLFMTVPDLCRLRSVCKAWNELLCKPNFHDLCELNRKENGYLLVTCHLDHGEFIEFDPAIKQSMSLRGLNARQWFRVKRDESILAVDDERATLFLITDGGLVCEMMSFGLMNVDLALAISDPITGIRKELPELPVLFYDAGALPIIVTAVDAGTRSYKVFIINNSDEEWMRLCEYDSSTDEWRALKIPIAVGYEIRPKRSAVVFGGMLYVIFLSFPGRSLDLKFDLLRYSLQEDAWESVKVDIPRRTRHPELVVSCNRLFVTFWLGEPCLPEQSYSQIKLRLSFQVREILVAENSSRMVVQIPKTHLQQMFGEEDVDFDIECAVPFINWGEICDSIVLMSTFSGKLISYNPVSGWVVVLSAHPQSSAVPDRDEDFDSPTELYQVKYRNLSLRNLSSQFFTINEA